MVKTRKYGKHKAKKHTRRRHHKTSFRKNRSMRKPRTKQKRKRGGYQEVELYREGLQQINNANEPDAIIKACKKIQWLLKYKFKTLGCKWQLNQDKIQECRVEKKYI